VDGDYFGEISLIFRGQRRTATVVAVEVCEVYKLAHQDFNTLFQPHKDLLDKLKSMAMKRLCHNKDEFRNEIIENFVLI
jgi:hyperpolarization activated cyclic nucleotide-gated potassium channel 2